MENIFKKIIAGEIPCAKLYEDDHFLAFLDISPVNKGHALVVPKKECVTLLECDPQTLQNILLVVQKVAIAIKTATNADGFNIMLNNGKAAGQVVPHMHFHIIPRFDDDGFKFNWANKTYSDGEMDDLKNKILKHLSPKNI